MTLFDCFSVKNKTEQKEEYPYKILEDKTEMLLDNNNVIQENERKELIKYVIDKSADICEYDSYQYVNSLINDDKNKDIVIKTIQDDLSIRAKFTYILLYIGNEETKIQALSAITNNNIPLVHVVKALSCPYIDDNIKEEISQYLLTCEYLEVQYILFILKQDLNNDIKNQFNKMLIDKMKFYLEKDILHIDAELFDLMKEFNKSDKGLNHSTKKYFQYIIQHAIEDTISYYHCVEDNDNFGYLLDYINNTNFDFKDKSMILESALDIENKLKYLKQDIINNLETNLLYIVNNIKIDRTKIDDINIENIFNNAIQCISNIDCSDLFEKNDFDTSDIKQFSLYIEDQCISKKSDNGIFGEKNYFQLILNRIKKCTISSDEYSEYIYQGINSEYLNLSFADNQSNGQSGSKKNLLFGSKSESGSKSKSESGFMPSKYLDTSCAVNKNNSQLGSQEKLLFGSESESIPMPSKYLNLSCADNQSNSKLGSQENLLFGSESESIPMLSKYLETSFADNQSNSQFGSKENLLSEFGSGFISSKYLKTSCADNQSNSQFGSKENLLSEYKTTTKKRIISSSSSSNSIFSF